MDEEATGRRQVAAGPSRGDAVRVFGELFDDLLVTSYDDFGAEIDLTSVDVLALADAPDVADLLGSLLARDARPGRLLIEVPDEAGRRARLADELVSRPDVGVVAIRRTTAATVLELGGAGPSAVSGAAVAIILDAIPSAVHGPPPLWTDLPEPRTDGSTPTPVRRRRGPRQPAPRVSPAQRLRRLGRRGRVALGVLGVAVLLAILVPVIVGRSELGADGVIVVLLLEMGLLQGVAVIGVAYLVRGTRRSRAENHLFHDIVLRRTDRIVEQGKAARRGREAAGRRSSALLKAMKRSVLHHEYVVELGRQLTRQLQDAQSVSQRRHLITERQTQALLNLRDLVEVRAAVPPMGGWAASPDLVLYCVELMITRKPDLIVECGSGISTLYLALAAEQHGLATRIVALEHQVPYAEATRVLLERHGVAHRAEVRLAPLEQPTSVSGHETPWYAESALAGLEDIGILLVDGPPTATGPQARYPAVPLLRDRLAKTCAIVMDDLVRPSDHETADRWAALLPDFDYAISRELDKHIGILRRG